MNITVEDKYIKEEFIHFFLNNMNNPIVIYGIGIHTEILLKNLNDTTRIVGLMDAKHTGEIMFGKKVLSCEEVADISDVIIVILARSSVINVIFRRIESFINKYNIKVFDVNGTELTAHIFSDEIKECYCCDEKKARELICESEIVSFDIFDTLLCRCVMRPSDVFKLMDAELSDKAYVFSDERIMAEGSLDKLVSPTIYEIYDRLSQNIGISEQESSCLLALELEMEKKVLRRRESVCELLKYAKTQGKRVLLISDMYFTKKIIAELMTFFDITDYDEIYVSSEYHKTKATGLYDIVEKAESISGKWLHIGDNGIADIEIPMSKGINIFRIYSTTEMLEQSIYSGILEFNNSLEENLVIARFAVDAYNSPFDGYGKSGKLYVDAPNKLAGLLIAPTVFKFMIWLVKKLKEEGKELVLFPSRDGFLLKKIYDFIANLPYGEMLPEGVYFYTSRRASMVASVQNLEDIKRISDFPGEMSPDIRAKKRFELQDDDCVYMSDEYIEKAFKRSKIEYDNYLKYIDVIGCEKYSNIAFVDFVAIGTIQEALQKIFDRELQGYYFLRRTPDTEYRNNMKVESLFGICSDYQLSVNLYKYYYFLEMIVTSYEPSLKYFDDAGKPVFYAESRTKEEMDIIKEMHRGIYDYCIDMIPLALNNISDSSVELYDKLLGLFSADSIDIKQGVIDKMVNVDEFLEKKVSEINR